MSEIAKWREAKMREAESVGFTSLIGKAQKTTAKAVGYVHSVIVKTTIHHQEVDGAKNYHECSPFDTVLGQVIKENFQHLTILALEKLRENVRRKAIDAQDEVRAMQDEIDKACEVQP